MNETACERRARNKENCAESQAPDIKHTRSLQRLDAMGAPHDDSTLYRMRTQLDVDVRGRGNDESGAERLADLMGLAETTQRIRLEFSEVA